MSEKQRRNGHRLVVSRTVNKLVLILSQSAVDVFQLEVQTKILKDQKKKIECLDEEIQKSISDEDELLEDMETSLLEITKLEESLLKAEEKIKELKHPRPIVAHNANASSVVKLPTMNLRKFGGKPLEWPQFWDAFQGSVNSRTDLTESQKFSYLIGQLEGEALLNLDGLTITDAHYSEAISLLKRTYGKPNAIVQAHLHAILDLECVDATSKELSKFRASYECHLRGLKTMKMKVDEAGYVYVTILLRKLPVQVRDNINRANNSNDWTLDSFRDAVEKEIEHLSATEPDQFRSSETRVSQSVKNSNSSKPKSTVGSFVLSTKSNLSNCKFCLGDHKTYLCTKYQSPSEKMQRAKDLHLCFNCLADNHPVFSCRWRSRCSNCKRKHNTLLCMNKENKQSSDHSEKKEVKPIESTVAAVNIEDSKLASQSVALPTAIMPIKNENHMNKFVRALFDQCSQRTFILQSIVNVMHLEVKNKIKLCVDGFQSKTKEKIYDLVEFVVEVEENIRVEAVVVKTLPSRIKIAGISQVAKQLKSEGVKLADYLMDEDVVSDVGILIGADQFYKFVYGLTAYGDIHLISSSLGMMVTGPIQENQEKSSNTVVQCASVINMQPREYERMNEEISKLWSMDVIGICANEDHKSEDNVLQQFADTIAYSEGRYTVNLPWKKDHPFLKSNYKLAEGRLKSTLARLRKRPELLSSYNKILKDYEERNFIEKVSTDKIRKFMGKVHYLSHHGVLRPSATTPIRIVYDCSAGRPSLNDCLQSGPCLLNELCKIILRFRVGRFAVVSDITKAFLMIQLAEEDRNVTLFMWPNDPWSEDSEVSIYRFRVVLFGATCSPFLLNATILHHLSLNTSDVTKSIERNIYVDNLQSTAEEETTLISFYEEAKKIMIKANLNLREWDTNSPKLMKKISSEGDGRVSKNGNPKVLGMEWRTTDDILFCNGFTPTLEKNEFTKRNILSCVSKLFDPLGLLTPISIRAKIFLQDLWRKKISWDEVLLDDEDYNFFMKIVKDLQTIVEVGVPRQVAVGREVNLHSFSDASSKAYGAVIYITSEGRSSLVIAKGRVAPMKELSIPKLELTAATVSARLVSYILETYSEEYKFLSVNYWTDSKVVLSWISSEKILKPFEKNRVNEIIKLSSKSQWKYINTKSNPADILSRGTKANKLIASELWFNGPRWLPSKNDWPEESDFDASNFKVPYVTEEVLVTTVVAGEEVLFDPGKFSSLTFLFRVTAVVRKFIKMSRQKKEVREDSILTATDIQEAEYYWIKRLQFESYSEELKFLRVKKGNPPNLVKQLNLFCEQEIIRCRGRIEHADIEFNSKYPILLPPKNHVTVLYIRNAHNKVHHFGASSVVEYLRRNYWIPQMRQNVKATIRNCVTCKRIQGKPYKAPPFPPLPELRIQESKPFNTTGVDYTGALFVKNGKETQKAYIVLFTCAVTRAIHLEVVQDNTRDTFIRAFRRFVGRRSCPRFLISDNSQTFTSSAKFLKKLQKDSAVQNELSNLKCEWKFIPSRSPWYGGFWERMIALTKTSLKKILGRAMVSLEELQTIVIEIESSLNDRPISFASDDIDDVNALTPSLLIYGFKLGNLPDPLEEPDPTFMEETLLTSRQRIYSNLRSQFWRRWRKEYLLALRERNCKFRPTKDQVIQVGDIVIIHDENLHRLQWKIGRIIRLNRSSDGQVRSAQVKTATGEISRPIIKLYPLEVRSKLTESGKDDDASIIVKTRPMKRKAAIEARNAISRIDY